MLLSNWHFVSTVYSWGHSVLQTHFLFFHIFEHTPSMLVTCSFDEIIVMMLSTNDHSNIDGEM